MMIGAIFGFPSSSAFVFLAGEVSMYDCCWLFLVLGSVCAFVEVCVFELVCSWVWGPLLSSVSMSVADKPSNLFCVAIVGFCSLFMHRFLWVSASGRLVLSVDPVDVVFGEL